MKKQETIAHMIVNYSINVKEKERVLITCSNNESKELVKKLIKEIVDNKGIPFVRIIDNEIEALLVESTNSLRINEIVKAKQFEIESFDSFINIRYASNDYEERLISWETLKEIGIKTKEIEDIRINQRKWVALKYPSQLDAYKAKMKNDEFYDYAMRAMTFNYEEMAEMIRPLKNLMENTDKVRIVGPDTDVSFSIKGMPIIPCVGRSNLPDGEIFVAPIKTSVEGKIQYNTDSPFRGSVFSNISFVFEKGEIISASCDGDNNQLLHEIIATDEGSKYIGEFSIGLNPAVLKPMGDILYDEKIIGSIHFTPGRAYRESYNGNDSAIHWDIVLIQREEYGGGEIYFDDKLIKKDGFFVDEELKHLNYGLDNK